MSKLCQNCQEAECLPRKIRCRECYNAYNRAHYHANHERSLEVRAALYEKHADKRREESSVRKKENRERYTLLEWFRKRGISAAELGEGQLDALVDMKKALIASQQQLKEIENHAPH